MKTRPIVLGVCFLLSMSVTAYAQKVTTDFDKAAPFSQFKTYAWIEGTPAKSPQMRERITESIDKQLAVKGLLKIDRDSNPDLLVAYHAATDVETQVYTTGWAYSGDLHNSGGENSGGNAGCEYGNPKRKEIRLDGQGDRNAK